MKAKFGEDNETIFMVNECWSLQTFFPLVTYYLQQKTEGTLEFMDKSFEVMQGNPERRADDKMARFITGTFVFIYRDCM